jgi:hypothetical protein
MVDAFIIIDVQFQYNEMDLIMIRSSLNVTATIFKR